MLKARWLRGRGPLRSPPPRGRGSARPCVGANLQEAELQDADLDFANLQGANLTLAKFEGADLDGANLHGADGLNCDQLKQAKVWEDTFRSEELACGSPIVPFDEIVKYRAPQHRGVNP